MNSQEITPGHLNVPYDKQDTLKITQYNFICIFKYNLINLRFMFIKYIMQLSSTIQKIEYDSIPERIVQMVPIRTPHYIPRHFSTHKNSILYNYLDVLSNV